MIKNKKLWGVFAQPTPNYVRFNSPSFIARGAPYHRNGGTIFKSKKLALLQAEHNNRIRSNFYYEAKELPKQ